MLNLFKWGTFLLSLITFLLINPWKAVVVLRGWWIMNAIILCSERVLVSSLSICITSLISTLRNSTLVNNASPGGGISFLSLSVYLFFWQTLQRQMGFVKLLGFRLCYAQQKHVWHKQHAHTLIHFSCRLNYKNLNMFISLKYCGKCRFKWAFLLSDFIS